MAGPTGFEPATSRLTIWRPNQAERRPHAKNGKSENPAVFCIVSQIDNSFRSTVSNVRLVGGTGIEPVTSAL